MSARMSGCGNLLEIPTVPWLGRRPWRGADGDAEREVLKVLVVMDGEVGLQIPELGKREVWEWEWCIYSDRGTALEKRTRKGSGIETELPLKGLEKGLEGLIFLPPKMACLTCPGRGDSPFFMKGPCCGRMKRLGSTLHESVEDTISSCWRRQAMLAELLALVFERPELQAAPPCRSCSCGRSVASLEAAARHMEENLCEAHCIAGLARRVYLNECKLKKGFKEHFGMTVIGFLRHKRMEHAWGLLQETEATVIEVANAVGYSNASHFARAFREVHGVNPREVRRGEQRISS